VLVIKNLRYKFFSTNPYTLDGINLEVKKGECIVFCGASGSGKTTLTRCINGLIPEIYGGEIEGSILIGNKELKGRELWEDRAVCGSVFQDPRSQFFTTETVSEVAFGLENYGTTADEINSRISEVFSLLKIEKLKGKSVFELSSGERQKVAIASAFALNPDIILLDEPSANLDAKSTIELGINLQILKDRGFTIIISEHRLYYLRDIIDNFYYIDSGKISWSADSSKLKKLSTKYLNSQGLRSFVFKKRSNQTSLVKKSSLSLEVKNLFFKYKKSDYLLKNIGFKISAGEIVGVIGSNGAGKTTLLKILMGILKPNKGEIYINNEKLNSKQRLKQCYFVMQDPDYQLYSESVEDEMLLGCNATHEEQMLSTSILESLGMLKYKDAHPGSLSMGQKQRIVIGVALLQNRDIVFFDEPTSGLDFKNMKIISNSIKKLATNGKIVCIISHDYEFLSDTCTRVISVKDSKIGNDKSIEKIDLYSEMFDEN
jgi:energy-coupling factor transport system ATP-binding protein